MSPLRTAPAVSPKVPVQRTPWPGVPGDGLLASFAELAATLREALAAAAGGSAAGGGVVWAAGAPDPLLDAFLMTAALSQVLDDFLQRDVLELGRIARYLVGVGGRWKVVAAAPRAMAWVASGLRARGGGTRRAAAARDEIGRLLGRIADDVAAAALERGDLVPAGRRPHGGDVASSDLAALLSQRLSEVPEVVRREVARPPGCYAHFDQHPVDCARLVERFAARWPDRDRPLLVLGIRTSGSYLAPLSAALLRHAGYHDVQVMTLRPSWRLPRTDAKRLREAAARDALAAPVDDAPRTGAQLAHVADLLRRSGFPVGSIVPLIQLFGGPEAVPKPLRQYPAVVMDWEQWSVHERLAPASVRATLEELLTGSRSRQEPPADVVGVAAVEQAEPVAVLPPGRGHVAASYLATLERSDGGLERRRIWAEGVGLGCFGRRALAIADAMGAELPAVHGVRDGLVFGDAAPADCQLDPARVHADPEAIAAGIAGYVWRRSRSLAAPHDVTARMVGRDAAWEWVAVLLAHAFGAGRPVVRPLADVAGRRLVEASRPSVIDGNCGLGVWMTDAGGETSLGKRDFLRGPFSAAGMYSYDPVLDLAAAAADGELEGALPFVDELRSRYEAASGERLDDAGWLMRRLAWQLSAYQDQLRAAASGGRRVGDAFERVLEIERAMSRGHQRYMEQRFFADLVPPKEGPLCAIDLDGVLETRWHVFPAIAPAGARAVRALHRHGYRVVIASGRSLDEIRERCRAYRLAGGVAEYGAALYDATRDTTHSLLTEAQGAALTRARDALARQPGVHVDPAYRHSVRAHTIDAKGRRAAPSRRVIDAALADAGCLDDVAVVAGDLQSDVIGRGIDKGRGLRSLAALLGTPDDGSLLALAVGDSPSDLAMFDLAARASAPANAMASVRERAQITRRPYGSGLLESVGGLLGHEPHRCRTCRPAKSPTYRDRLLLCVLGALDGGRAHKVMQALRLAMSLAAGGERRPAPVPRRGFGRS
jgi:hydroxymethylpyrimidine pyrophosphatase-like HAD family hydrolase